MAPDTAVSMRHTKIKAEEAALLAGELKKPSWQSKNEGIHERVSFEDSIWGFDLAGGAYYKTPLRVTFVKPDSRAEKAGIRPGDKLLRINDIDTSTLTIQEAHEIIIESGIHLKLAVTAPEDEEDSYYCYEDQIEEGYDSEEERRKEEEKARKRQVHAKVSSYWSLQWPWVSKRRVIYRESNCFMVPSKYEEKHRDRFSPQPMIRTQDDIVLESINSEISKKRELARGVKTETVNKNLDSAQIESKNNDVSNLNGNNSNKVIKDSNKLGYISEVEEDSINEDSVVSQVNESSVSNDDLESSSKISKEEQPSEEAGNQSDDEVGDDANHEAPEVEVESNKEESSISELDSTTEETSHSKEDEVNSKNDKINTDDEVISEVLSNKDDNEMNDNVSKDDEDKILNGIIGDDEHGESNNER